MIHVQLLYQSVAHPWARNLEDYKSDEPQRCVSYYGQMAAESAIMLARAARAIER
jgi:hypothetical protein